MREKGYYKVKYITWEIAYFVGHSRMWMRLGTNVLFDDSDFSEIGERIEL